MAMDRPPVVLFRSPCRARRSHNGRYGDVSWRILSLCFLVGYGKVPKSPLGPALDANGASFRTRPPAEFGLQSVTTTGARCSADSCSATRSEEHTSVLQS